mmetsp:Transcript_98374/g.278600  ORF Transcript_98374/g.278600 Transcript_98374/m.278600 type:complete len:201 (+) Transcript_98374:122-724(+)
MHDQNCPHGSKSGSVPGKWHVALWMGTWSALHRVSFIASSQSLGMLPGTGSWAPCSALAWRTWMRALLHSKSPQTAGVTESSGASSCGFKARSWSRQLTAKQGPQPGPSKSRCTSTSGRRSTTIPGCSRTSKGSKSSLRMGCRTSVPSLGPAKMMAMILASMRTRIHLSHASSVSGVDSLGRLPDWCRTAREHSKDGTPR